MKLSLFLVVAVTALHTCVGLSCLPCREVDCEPPKGCQYGQVTGICGCCDVCAKGPGETCGGMWLLNGKCGVGMRCEPIKNQPNYHGVDEYLEGECVWKKPRLGNLQLGQKGGIALGGGRPGVSRLSRPVRAGRARKRASSHSIQLFGGRQNFRGLLKRPERSPLLEQMAGGV